MTTSLTLTPTELVELTGYVRTSKQREWLKRNGWRFTVSASGHPVVARAYFERRLVDAGKAEPPAAASPNWSAMGV